MRSDKFICPSCGDEKTAKEEILPVTVLEGHILHLFCTKCGFPYRVTVTDGQYDIGPILAVDE
jgi:transcription elongation factor Elf1